MYFTFSALIGYLITGAAGLLGYPSIIANVPTPRCCGGGNTLVHFVASQTYWNDHD